MYVVLIYQYHDPVGMWWQTTLVFLIKKITHSSFHSFKYLGIIKTWMWVVILREAVSHRRTMELTSVLIRGPYCPFTESSKRRPLVRKTVKRREEKDSEGSREETANDGSHCSEVSMVPSISSFSWKINAHFWVLELNDWLVYFC